MSRELKEYLTSRGVATSRTTPYHPTGNVQCERWNQTIWRTINTYRAGLRYICTLISA